jgi:hypothetical protein
LEELKELESEFIRFLASQSIPADDWEKMKTRQPERAEGLIGIFSDIVFDKILGKVEYLEHRRRQDLRVYKFLNDRIQMLGLVVENAPNFDFERSDSPQEMIARLNATGGRVRLFSGEKKFRKTKEMEAFQLMEEGALISKDDSLYALLSGLQP